MTLAINPSVAVMVTAYAYGAPVTDEHGFTYAPVTGVQPGARLDVQRECVAAFPALAAYQVEPANPVHDPGPNGVRLYADTWAELQAAAPPRGSEWDVWVDAP